MRGKLRNQYLDYNTSEEQEFLCFSIVQPVINTLFCFLSIRIGDLLTLLKQPIPSSKKVMYTP